MSPQPSELVRDSWPKQRKRIISLITLLNLIFLGLTMGALWFTGIWNTDLILGLVITGIVAAGLIIEAMLVYLAASRPLKTLLDAVLHISDEPNTATPPSLNDPYIQRSGLKPAIATIYSAASTGSVADAEAAEEAPTTTPHSPLTAALDSSLCGFVVMNKDRQITYANNAAPIRVDNDGIKSLELMFEHDNTLDTWWDQCAESSIKADYTWARIANKLPNEEGRRFFDVIASYNKGTDSEVVLVLIDRTHLYQVGEEELDFIAFAAHELRGPITVIRGYIDVLQQELGETIDGDQKALFRRLEVSANRLSGYVNNILNTSRYDRRHLKMHLAETTLAAIYDTIADDMSLRATSQGRILNATIDPNLPSIAADTASLSEVVSNLIDNAVKYSNEGGTITVSTERKGDTVELHVKDTGIGMPGNVVGNLFQKFYRSHRSRETVAGTGIGLYISKAIVESHGGTISVASREGEGSTFTVALPTYQSIAHILETGDTSNEGLLKKAEEGVWIKNHTSFRG